MDTEHLQMAGIVNTHLYFVEAPFLFLNLYRVYGIKLKIGNSDIEIFDPYEPFGLRSSLSKDLDLTIVTAWICYEESNFGEYSGFEPWHLISDYELQLLSDQTGNHVYIV
jgi:hypothetical protein